MPRSLGPGSPHAHKRRLAAFVGYNAATGFDYPMTMHGSVSRSLLNRPQGGDYNPSKKYPEHERRNRILPAIRLPLGLLH
jgi:hypothetical protein